MTDQFGVKKLYSTILTKSREWYSQWHIGTQRNFSFGPAGKTDPELIFRGNGKYIIYGSTGTNAGQMWVTGSCPRIYVRPLTDEVDILPVGTPKWENVEVTFYANTTNPGASVGYAGIEAVARTNHYPDSALCGTRGYGGKINFDGRAQFEKECAHDIGNKQTANTYPFGSGVKMPIKQWIGYKFIVRGCEKNTKCKLELWLDMTDGLNGGTWKKVNEFTDYEGWSSTVGTCCTTHKGKVLPPNYVVYLRSDGLGDQYYKKFSIREIDPLP